MSKSYKLPRGIFDAHNHLYGEDDGSTMIDWMDRCGVEKTLIMGGRAEGANERIVNAVCRCKGRLVGGAYYDPRKGKKAVEELKRWSGEGLRIVKLFPNLGYFPDDSKYEPFFDKVADLKLGVLSHCGWLGPSGDKMFKVPWASYHATPCTFEKVIRTHSETIFIMAHFGGILGVLEAVMLSTRTPNTYIDCSPGQGLWAIEHCGAVAGSIPPEKLLYGTDGIGTPELIELYRKALVKIGYVPHLDKIFRSNTQTLFEKLGFNA